MSESEKLMHLGAVLMVTSWPLFVGWVLYSLKEINEGIQKMGRPYPIQGTVKSKPGVKATVDKPPKATRKKGSKKKPAKKK